jgi:uncharacterized protein (TIGR02001 family)
MKTRILAAAALLAAFAGEGARAQDRSYSVTTDFAYASDYVFRGIEHADDSVQPSVEIDYPNAYLGVWLNQPLKRRQHNEIDLYGGYRYKVNRAVSLEAVATYYGYPQASGFQTRQTYEAGFGATYTFRGIAASAYLYRDFKLDANVEQASVNYSVPLTKLGTSLDFNGFVGAVQAADWQPNGSIAVKQSYSYYGVNLAMPYKIAAKTDVTAGVHWAHNDGLPSAFNDDHVWWSLSVTMAF